MFTPRRIGQAAAVVCLVLVVVTFVRHLSVGLRADDGMIGALPTALMLLIIAGGALLAGEGWPRLEGEDPHCGACGYGHRAGPIVAHCPECGAAWRWYGGCTRGRPSYAPQLLIPGLLLLTMAFGALTWRAVNPRSILRLTPTPVLITKLAAADQYAMDDLLRELDRRLLANEDEESITRRLLDRRLADGWMSGGAHDWIVVRLGAMSEASTTRFFGEMASVDSDAPARVARDRWFEVLLTGFERMTTFDGVSRDRAWLVVDRVDVTSAEGTPIAARVAVPEQAIAVRDLDTADGIPIRVSNLGDARVRVEARVVVAPTGSFGTPLLRTDEGDVNLNVVAPVWVTPVVFNHDLQVMNQLNVE